MGFPKLRNLLLAAMTWSALAHAATAEGVKVYTGPEGLEVDVVTLAPASNGQVVIQFKGSESELDGKAMPCKITVDGDRTRYVTQVAGRERSFFNARANSGTRTFEVYVPGGNRDVRVSYDEKKSQTFKPEGVLRLYEQQKADGTLAKYQSFNRPLEQAAQETTFQAQVKTANAACATKLAATVDWKSISDEMLKGYNIASFCGPPLEALQNLCANPSVKAVIQQQIQRVECRFGAALALDVKAGVAHWATFTEGSNQETFAANYLEKNVSGPGPKVAPPGSPAPPPANAQALAAPWGKGVTLGELKVLDQTRVCTDGKKHFVVLSPNDAKLAELYSGEAKTLYAARAPGWGMPGSEFLEPRYVNPTANPNFRGSDMRIHSSVEVDAGANTCKLHCGVRTVPLTVLSPADAQSLVLAATLLANPQRYAPHALLRDDHGRYYLVDRGIRPEEAKSFRVFIGNKGKLELQKLVNVVADSEGEVFSTKKGDLRLLVDKVQASTWVQGGKKVQLRAVPLEENLPLIYSDLGVYEGQRLGTPCDDI